MPGKAGWEHQEAGIVRCVLGLGRLCQEGAVRGRCTWDRPGLVPAHTCTCLAPRNRPVGHWGWGVSGAMGGIVGHLKHVGVESAQDFGSETWVALLGHPPAHDLGQFFTFSWPQTSASLYGKWSSEPPGLSRPARCWSFHQWLGTLLAAGQGDGEGSMSFLEAHYVLLSASDKHSSLRGLPVGAVGLRLGF